MSAWRLSLLFLLAMPGHWLLAERFAFWGISPQLLLVLTVALAARQGPLWGMGLGFGWGLFLDLLSPRLFGANALAFTLMAYGTGSVRRQVDVSGRVAQGLVAFFMTMAYFLFLGLLGAVFAKRFLWVGWAPFVLDPFYNCLVTVVAYEFWCRRAER